MKEQLVVAIAVEVCHPESGQRAGFKVAAAPFVALRVKDRHAPPPRRAAEADAHVPASRAIEIAEVQPWNVVRLVSGGAAPPRPERVARLAIERRDLGHGARTFPRILAHDNVQASIAIDIADGESRRRHRIRIERVNPAGLAVRERQDPQLRRARPETGLRAEQHDDFTIAATVKVCDLVNEANGPVRAPWYSARRTSQTTRPSRPEIRANRY